MVALRLLNIQGLGLLRLLYSLAFHLSIPLVLLRLWWRARREPDYLDQLGQRFGSVPAPAHDAKVIWVHAVSAGETNAAATLIRQLLERYPDCLVWVTNMTPTGRARVRELFADELGQRVFQSWLPYDLGWCQSRFINAVKPELLILIDTELWPNMLAQAHKAGLPAMLVNGRLSESSARGYARAGGLSRSMIQSFRHILVQTAPQRERFVALGADPGRVVVTGSIKADQQLPADLASRLGELRPRVSTRPVMMGASTHEGEEAVLLNWLEHERQQGRNSLLILAPRHPQRTDAVLGLCQGRGMQVDRRSEVDYPTDESDVFLLDTMGELIYYYGVADLAFVGGSMVPVGGHNFLEASCHGIPVIMGPYLHNLDEVPAAFIEAGVLKVVQDSEALVRLASELLADPEQLQQLGSEALRLFRASQGGLTRTMEMIQTELGGG